MAHEMFTSSTLDSKISRTCAKHVEDRQVGVEDLIAQKFELNTDFTLANYRIHQTAVFMFHPPTGTQTTSMVEPSEIETSNVPKWFINHNRITSVRVMVSNKSIMERSMATSWVGTNTRLMELIKSTTSGGGDLDTRGSFTRDRWTQTDTIGQHHDAHHIYSKQCVSLLRGCKSSIFQHEQNVPQNLATATGASSSSMRLVAMRDLLNTGEGQVHLQTHTVEEKSSVEQCLYEIREKFLPISKMSRSTKRFETSSRATACGLHLGLARITKTSKE